VGLTQPRGSLGGAQGEPSSPRAPLLQEQRYADLGSPPILQCYLSVWPSTLPARTCVSWSVKASTGTLGSRRRCAWLAVASDVAHSTELPHPQLSTSEDQRPTVPHWVETQEQLRIERGAASH